MRRVAPARAGFRALPRAPLFGREQALPALRHAVPCDPGLEIPGGARHAAAFVGVFLEFLDDVHLLPRKMDRWTSMHGRRSGSGLSGVSGEAHGRGNRPDPASARSPRAVKILKALVFLALLGCGPPYPARDEKNFGMA
jgi:hypothetical protein